MRCLRKRGLAVSAQAIWVRKCLDLHGMPGTERLYRILSKSCFCRDPFISVTLVLQSDDAAAFTICHKNTSFLRV